MFNPYTHKKMITDYLYYTPLIFILIWILFKDYVVSSLSIILLPFIRKYNQTIFYIWTLVIPTLLINIYRINVSNCIKYDDICIEFLNDYLTNDLICNINIFIKFINFDDPFSPIAFIYDIIFMKLITVLIMMFSYIGEIIKM